MTAIAVDSMAAAVGIVDKLQHRLTDFRPLWERIEHGFLPQAQLRQWDRRWDIGWRHGAWAIRARKNRLPYQPGSPYYRDLAPNERSGPDRPFFEWTGALRKSTDHFTSKGARKATIDPDANYFGPLTRLIGRNVFTRTVVYGHHPVPESNVWNQAYLERGIERELERWIAEEIARLN